MPHHGDRRGSRIIRITRGAHPVPWESPNGEGVTLLPATEDLPTELRWCSGCGEWHKLIGIIDFFMFDYVGCPYCGRSFPSSSKST